MNNPTTDSYEAFIKNLPKKRMAAGAIIQNKQGQLLMLVPSYKPVLEIPGGIVEQDESPYVACKREIKEEIGLDLSITRMLCVDYNSPQEKKTESLMFIFDGGIIEEELIPQIKVDKDEILSYQFMTLAEIEGKTTNSLYNRIKASLLAIEKNCPYYLENQLPIF